MKRWTFITCCLLLLSLVGALIIDGWIRWIAAAKMVNSIEALPLSEIGLVLGIPKYLKDKSLNLAYLQRIAAASNCFHNNKVEHLILSGNNRPIHYNEPRTMRRDLMRNQVPEVAMTMDYGGFSIVDSMVRSHQVFKVNEMCVIAQRFECERALFVAHYLHLTCYGYNVSPAEASVSNWERIQEIWNRVKLVFDLYILQRGARTVHGATSLPFTVDSCT